MAKIKPIEEFIISGLLHRYQQVFFGCRTILAASEENEKLNVSKLNGNDRIQYPYAILRITDVSYGTTGLINDNYFGRHGVLIKSNEADKLGLAVRFIPATFEVECKFITNSNSQAIEYSKLWLFAYRFGHLNFNLNYGGLTIACNVTCSESVNIPQAVAKTEGMTEYIVVATATVHGYMSKPQLAKKPLLHDIKEVVSISGNNENAAFVNKVVWQIPSNKK